VSKDVLTTTSPEQAEKKVRGDKKSLPFSPSVRRGNTIYISGLIPVDEGMNLLGETIEEQTRAVMDSIGSELARHGANYSNLVKTTILLADADRDWPAMNDVYREYVADLEVMPARASYGVQLAAPELLVEIEAIAVLD
jgi:2-iminobutanoate/2-iminopropanoate deaminase